MKKLFLVLTIAVSLFTVSCKKEEEATKSPFSEIELTSIQLDQRRNEFARILAQALTNERVRILIKNEAEKQFDLDYDVLYQMVKDTEISPGISFAEYLASLAGSEKKLSELTESLPLLTILVPNLKKFSTEKWDASTQIPIVAVVNSNHDEKSKLS